MQAARGVDDDDVEPRAVAASSASKTTADGSAPAACATTGTSMRPAQAVSCSMAAARNVSAAASRTRCAEGLEAVRRAWRCVVVLPVPLTPTTRMTAGMRRAGLRGQGTAWRVAKRARSSSCSAVLRPPRRVRARARSQTSMARSAPEVRRDEGLLDLLPGRVVRRRPVPSRLRTRSAKPRRVGRRASSSRTRLGAGRCGSVGHAAASVMPRRPSLRRSSCADAAQRVRGRRAGPPGAARRRG